MSYTFNEAKNILANLVQGSYTIDDLLNLAKQVDVTADRRIAVLHNRA